MDYFDKSILKKKKKNNYTNIANGFLQDSSLSFEARGLGASLLSRPEDWEINIASLMVEGNIGRDKIKKIINELIQAGYMYKAQSRTSGKFGKNILFISDEKDYLFEEVIEKDKVQPLTEKPLTVEPLTENPEQQKKEYNKKKNITKKATAIQDNLNKINHVSPKDKNSSSSSYEFLNNYEFDAGTKENIKRRIKGLTEERFKLVYSKILKKFQEGKIDDFPAVLFTALKDNWEIKAEETPAANTEKEKKKVKGDYNYWLACFKSCGGSPEIVAAKFESGLKNIKNKNLVAEYKKELLKAMRKEE